jgi:integrase/recombinase XerD
MNKHFNGIYGPYMDEYLAFKRKLGFKQQTEESVFAVFDQFTLKRGETTIGITRELAEDWMAAGVNLSDSYNYHRAVQLNQFASFLSERGIRSYIMQLPKNKTIFTPYIYSNNEMDRIFKICDGIRVKRGLHSIIFALPALIRLLYATGLRISEALALQEKDVNLEDQYLVIRDSKNGLERMIPFSDSLAAVLNEYVEHKSQLPISVLQNEHFFIALDGRPVTRDAAYRWFRKILIKAEVSLSDGGPRLHSLRHSFSVYSLAMMAERGIDLYCALPVLSSYLGHKTIESTNAYVRLVSVMYPNLLKDIDQISLNVFPNTAGHETN